jgi:four helix bundle protein
MYKNFQEMPVWQLAFRLSEDVFAISSKLPRSEDYGLTSQIRRSSNSVSANIAEGFGRRGNKEKSHFYIIARGSAFETQNHLIYGNSVGYFKSEKTKELTEKYNKMIHDLNKIIKSISQPQPQP